MMSHAVGWVTRAVFAALAIYLVVVLTGPKRKIARAEVWLQYQVGGVVKPPVVAGRNGRLFLGNHSGNPPNSLIEAVCATGKAGAADRAGAFLRPVLDAGRATGLPFRMLIVPTAPRIYPEDLPAGMQCASGPVDGIHDPAVIYPLAAMQAMKKLFDPIPKRHFHWAGEGPLRVAELVADDMGLARETQLPLRPDRRASDFNWLAQGLALDDLIQVPDLAAAGVAQCAGPRCSPAVPMAIQRFTHAGPGRILVLADSFGDDIAGDWSAYAGQVWHVRMNLALQVPDATLVEAVQAVHPDAVIVVYHDAGALAADPASQASLTLAARLLAEVRPATAASVP